MSLPLPLARSLTTRMTLVTLVIFIAGLWCLAFYANLILRETMQRQLSEQQATEVEFQATTLNEDLRERAAALEKVAGKISPAILGDAHALQSFLEDRPALQAAFSGVVTAYRAAGRIVAEVPYSAARIGVGHLGVDTVAAALQQGTTTIGRPVMGRTLRLPVFSITAPIRDQQGRVIGALSGVTDLSKPNFLDLVVQRHYGQRGYFLLADPRNRALITGSDKRLILQTLPAVGRSELIDHWLQGESSTQVVEDLQGVEVLVTTRPILMAGWQLLAALPTAEVFAPLNDIRLRILLATLVLTLLAGGLTWGLIRHQLAPMRSAARALATREASKEFPSVLPVAEADEIGQLIGGFNRLLLALRQREATLQQTEQGLLESQAVAHLGSYDFDLARDAWQSSPTLDQVFGIGTEFPRTRAGWAQLIHPEERGPMLAYLAKILATRARFEREYRIVRADNGAERWVAGLGKVDYDAAGTAVRIVGTIQDITERKLAEEALRQSEEQYRTLVDSARDIIFALTTDGRVAAVNPAFEVTTGLPCATVLGQHFTALIHEEDVPLAVELFGKVMRQEARATAQLRFRTAHGQPVIGEVHTALHRQEGRILGVLGIVRDVTERKQAEAELALREARFRAIFDHAPVGISLTTDEGVLLTNAEHARITGVPIEQSSVPGVFARASHPEDYARQMVQAQRFQLGEVGHYTVEKRYLHPDGRVQHAELTSRFYHDTSTGQRKILTILSDLTERKQAEALVQASLQEKEALLKEVHHRVKNNLQVITSLLRLEAGRSGQPDTKAVLKEMQGRVRSMALLHESLYRSGVFATIDLGSYLGQISTQSFRTLAATPGAVQLRLDLASVAVEMDQALPCGLLVNELVSNCFKHGFPDGRPGEVRVELQPVPGGPQWRLRVSDTGVGLPADFAARRDQSLGLQLVSDLARQIGGTLETGSGPGAAFTVILTLTPPKAQPAIG